MSEKTQRQIVIQALKPLDGRSVENVVGVGTPDVNYTEGWIELKRIPKWPVREKTMVRMDHYTNEQRIWSIQRWQRGGEVYMLILVESTQEWVLLEGPVAARLINKEPQSAVREHAVAVWTGSKQLKERLSPCLSRRANLRRAKS